MRKIVVVEHLSLDGVMQSPAAPEEDVRDGFAHGGWAVSRSDEVMGQEMSKGMGGAELLFGRVTYEQMYAHWPNAAQPNPFTEVLNNTRKYVVSMTLTEPLSWLNSTLLTGDGAKAVAALKQQPGKDLAILGSGVLVQSLVRDSLVDTYHLMIHPLVLGSGRRLFVDGISADLRLVGSVTTPAGVIIATYQPARP